MTIDTDEMNEHAEQLAANNPAAVVDDLVTALRRECGDVSKRIDGLVELRLLVNAQIKEEREAMVRLRRMIAASEPPKRKGNQS